MRSGRALCGLGLAVALWAPQPVTPTAACAAAAEQAALVIDTGPRAVRYCVTLDAQAVSGIHLIELAGVQHGLSYELGYGGQAVCMLAGVGPSGGDCFAARPLFWGYFRAETRGQWRWSELGAGSTVVEDGDMEGWAWGAGDGAGDHDPPRIAPAAARCRVLEAPGPSPSPSRDSTPAAAQPPPSPPPAPKPRPSSSRQSGRSRPVAVARTKLPPQEEASPPLRGPDRKKRVRPKGAGGPPAAGFAGLAGVVVIALLGTRLGRSRKEP